MVKAKCRKNLSLLLILVLTASMVPGVVFTVNASSAESVLVNEPFDSGTGGFINVSNSSTTNVSPTTANPTIIGGMSGNVLRIASTRSGTYNIAYKSDLSSTVSSSKFLALQFDIASQAVNVTSGRAIRFGAFDSNNNMLFRLNMKETAIAAISINGGTEVNVTGMTQQISYRVTATFDFVNKKQTINIVPTLNLLATPLLNATYDITTATNLARLGNPNGETYCYGKIDIDNLSIKAPATYDAAFKVQSDKGANVSGAIITVQDSTSTNTYATITTDANGNATTSLPKGNYTYKISGMTTPACVPLATAQPFSISDVNINLPVTLLEQSGASFVDSVVVGGGSSPIYKQTTGDVTSAAFSATIKDQYGLPMSSETVQWSISPETAGVSINSNGVVSVTNTANIPTDDKLLATVTAKSNTDITKLGTASIEIRDVKKVKTFSVSGASSIKVGTSATYTISNVVDQYGNVANVGDYTYALSSTSPKVTFDGLTATVTAGSVSDMEDIVITASSGTSSVDKTVTVYAFAYNEKCIDYVAGAANPRFGTITGLNVLIWPKATTTSAITLPSPVQFAPNKNFSISWKNAWAGSNTALQKRTLQFTNAAGASAFGEFNYYYNALQIAGANISGLSAASAWMDITIFVKTDAAGVTTANIVMNGVTTPTITVPSTVTEISKISLYTASAVPDDRIIGFRDIRIVDTNLVSASVTGDSAITKIKDKISNKQFTVAGYALANTYLPDEQFTWSIVGNPAGVTINETGMLAVEDTANVGDITLQATSKSNSNIIATKLVTIRDFAQVKSFTFRGPVTLNTNQKVNYRVTDVINEYDEPVDTTSVFALEGTGATITSTGELTSGNGLANFTVTATVGNVDGKKLTVRKDVRVINMLTKYDFGGVANSPTFGYTVVTPSDVTGTNVTELSSDNVKDSYISGSFNYNIDVTKYGDYNDANNDYSVTVYSPSDKGLKIKANGIDVFEGTKPADKDYLEAVMNISAINGVIALEFNGAVSVVEVSRNFRFDFGNGSVATGYIGIPAGTAYDVTKGYGFANGGAGTTNVAATGRTGNPLYSDGVNVNGTTFDIDLPNGLYSISMTKATTGRASPRINGGIVGMNVDMGGNGSYVPYGSTHEVLFPVRDGKAYITCSDGSSTAERAISALEIKRVADNTKRKTQIFLGGDSTVCNYYQTTRSVEPTAGQVQTGWGQLFQRYLSDDMVVLDLAASGSYARAWSPTVDSIIQMSEPGDYVLIQFGINDRSYSNVNEMKEYLTIMVNKCRANGLIPVLLNPQHSVSFWGDGVADYAKPTGSGNAGYFDAIRTLASNLKCLFIDNSNLTADYFAMLGKPFVSKNYFIYNYATNTQTDSLHLAYQGAKRVAEIVANDIRRQATEGKTDVDGNGFGGIKLNPVVPYTLSYVDSTGTTVQKTGTTTEYKMNNDLSNGIQLWSSEFRNQLREPVTKVTAQGMTTASIKAINPTMENKNLTLLLASYMADGKLADVKTNTIQLASGDTRSLEASVNVQTGYTTKIMVWNSMNSIIPLQAAQ